MEYDQLYELVFVVLRDMWSRYKGKTLNEGQFIQDMNVGTICKEVAIKASAVDTKNSVLVERVAHEFGQANGDKVREIVWRLVVQGLLVPRTISDGRNQFFYITELGIKVLEEGWGTPYDPFNFTKRLQASAPNLSDITRIYFNESLQCFLAGNTTACAVMLGVASEAEIIDLVDAYMPSVPTSERPNLERKLRKARGIKGTFDIFYTDLEQRKGSLPIADPLSRELDTFLQGIFQMILLYRNEAGHPTGHAIDRETAYASLALFLPYAARISELKASFQAKAGSSS